MAKVNGETRRGSIGQITYQGGARGTTARRRVIPRNPRTAEQQKGRTGFGTIAGQWRGLTEAQRQAWHCLAQAMPDRADGYHAFLRINLTLALCGMDGMAEPPEPPVFGLVSAAGLVANEAPTIRLVGLEASVAPDRFLIEAGAPMSGGLAEGQARFRMLTVLPGSGTPAADVDLTKVYVKRFGRPAAGERVVIRVTDIKRGFRGVPKMYSKICAGTGVNAD